MDSNHRPAGSGVTIQGTGFDPEATNDLVTRNTGEGIADVVGPIEDGVGGFLLVVKVPIPANEATPVFVRVLFDP